MKKKNSLLLLFCLMVLCFFREPASGTERSVYIHTIPSGVFDTLPAYYTIGLEYVSLSHFCKTAGIECHWDMYSERMTISFGDNTISFIQNNNFFQINDSIYQLRYPPQRFGGNLYLNAQEVAGIFSRFESLAIEWAENEKLFTITVGNCQQKVTEKSEGIIDSTDKAAMAKDTVIKKAVVTADTALHSDSDRQKGTIKTIVIDPGHGGKDPGAIGPSGVKEKDAVLAIGLALRDELQKNNHCMVYMTRSTDTFIPLCKRTKIANEKGADLFISIHANSIEGNKKRKDFVRGYKIFFLSPAKSEEDKLTAMIENSVIELEEESQKGDYLQKVLVQMASSEFLTESQDISIFLAESFEKSVKKVTKLHTGVGQANVYVLNGAFMPSVLVETCFISNPFEEKLLINNAFQKKMACAISDAILQFIKKYEESL